MQRDGVARASQLLAPSEKTYRSYSIISLTITKHQLEVLYPSAIIRQQKGRQQRGTRNLR